jgi:hypothetical protein
MTSTLSLLSQKSFSKSSSHSLIKDNAFFNFIYERTIKLNENKYAILKMQNNESELKINQIDPCSRLSITWFIFMSFFDIIYIGVLLPIILAYSSLTKNSLWYYIELICSIILILNIFINFCIGYLIHVQTELILCRDIRVSSYIYVRHGTFIVDILSCLASVVYIILSILDSLDINIPKSTNILLVTVLLFRFIRFIRVSKMLINGTITQTLLTYTNVPFTGRNSKCLIAFILVYIAFSIINTLSCVWFGVARVYGYDNTWITKAKLSKSPNLDNYIASLYYVVATVTTVGYGDITPSNTIERVIAMVFMLIGVLLFLAVIGMITQVFIKFDNLSDTYNLIKKMEGLEKIGTLNTLDKSVKREIKEYYQQYWFHEKDTQSTWSEFIEDLPGSKKYLIIQSLISNAVDNITELKHLSQNQKAILYANAHYVPFTWKEQELCFRGEVFEHYLLLVEGVIDVIEEDYVIHAPSLIGKYIVSNDFISCTLVAKKHCLVFKIKKDIIENLLSEIVQ